MGYRVGKFVPSRAPSEYADQCGQINFRSPAPPPAECACTRRYNRDGADAARYAHPPSPFQRQYRQFHPAVYGESLHRNHRRRWHPTCHYHPAPDRKTACLRLASCENVRGCVQTGPARRSGAASASSPASCLSGTSPSSFAGTNASARGRSQRSKRTRLWHISARC